MHISKRKFEKTSGFSLVELLVAAALLLVITAVIVPQFRTIRTSWAAIQKSSEIIQNAIVLDEHINRNLAAAKQITAVSAGDSLNGFIAFKDNLGTEYKYMLDNSYILFGTSGNETPLAGPASRFQIRCYTLNDLENPTTDVNNIRLVEIETDLLSSEDSPQSKSFVSSVFLHTNVSQACGMVGHWKFDETSGISAADSSGMSNNGTLVNGPSWTNGQIGGAIDLDGSNDYVNCGNNQILDITSDISIAFWFQADSLSNTQDLITKGDYDESYSVQATASNRIRFRINNNRLTSDAVLETGQWYHITAVRNGSTRKIYINGILDCQDTYSSPINVVSSNLTISSLAHPFNGKIDDVRIYDRALSDSEIAALANTLKYINFSENKTTTNAVSLSINIPSGTDQGDLLIAAVAVDSDAAASLAAPSSQGWTLIDRNAYNSEVTLGVWWKIADDSEPASHTFTWTPSRQAYGWIMRFTGCDPSNPINAFAAAGQASSTPTSPAVVTTVSDCIILRIGAFDDMDITPDDTGLANHSDITMDKAGLVLFEDGFETNFNQWTDGGTTDWNRITSQSHLGSYSARGRKRNTYLTSDNINTSTVNSFMLEFWYRDSGLDDGDNVFLQLYNGSTYVNSFELGNSPENVWNYYSAIITDSQYRKSNFRIRFDCSNISNGSEYIYVDDVKIIANGVSGGAGYTKLSSAASSGTAAFVLGSVNEAQMATIAIAPKIIEDCDGQISP